MNQEALKQFFAVCDYARDASSNAAAAAMRGFSEAEQRKTQAATHTLLDLLAVAMHEALGMTLFETLTAMGFDEDDTRARIEHFAPLHQHMQEVIARHAVHLAETTH